MERRFLNLTIDVYVPGRWYLSDPTTADGQRIEDVWQFTDGRGVADPGRMLIPIYRPGVPLDYTSAGVGLAPIVSTRVAFVFRDMAPNDIQLFPVEVEGQIEPYYLLNVTRTVQCIDEAACEEARRWTLEHGQPAKVGRYRVVAGLRIDKSKIGSERVFRTLGWSPPLIVDEEIKEALNRTGITGGRFEEV